MIVSCCRQSCWVEFTANPSAHVFVCVVVRITSGFEDAGVEEFIFVELGCTDREATVRGIAKIRNSLVLLVPLRAVAMASLVDAKSPAGQRDAHPSLRHGTFGQVLALRGAGYGIPRAFFSKSVFS